MPKPYQIVPTHLHPHFETYINDNTQFQEETATPETPIRSLFFVTSPEGRDGIPLTFDNEPAARAEFGVPNYKYYGQPLYNAYQFLKSQEGRAYIVRVMPEDASYSNVVLIAKVKISEVNNPKYDALKPELGPEKFKQMEVKYIAKALTDFRDGGELQKEMEALEKTYKDAQPGQTIPEGEYYLPIMAVRVAGKGKYGDNYRIRIVGSPEEDREYPYSFFRLEVLKMERTLLKKEIHVGSSYYDAHEGDNSLYAEDIINDDITGSKIVKVQIHENNVKRLFEVYDTKVAPSYEMLADKPYRPTLETFDVFNFLNVSTENDPFDTLKGVKIIAPDYDAKTELDAIVLGKIEGISLSGGADGALEVSDDSAKMLDRAKKIDDLYVKYMSGKVDGNRHIRKVLSKTLLPVDIILDACYSKDVKNALIKLIITRGDAFGYLDAGLLKTTQEAIEWATQMYNTGDRLFSKEINHGEVRDTYTGKRIPLTTTWFLAGRLPIHFKRNGKHIPFYGENYARVTGYLRNSFLPVIDPDDKDTIEAIYTRRCNYYQYIEENVIIRGAQGTSQIIWSDLSEESNMLVTLDIKRNIERLVSAKTYKFAEAEDLIQFTEEAQRMIAPYKANGMVRDADVSFAMNKWEEERSILHCYLWVIFKTINKRQIIEIDINKRV